MTRAAPRAASAILRSWVGDEDAPHSAMIEISDRCNETCVHCYQVHGQKGELSTDELREVIDQLADIGVLFLTLSGGEPTLRRDFLDIVAHARARGFVVSLYTNASRIDERMAAELGRLGLAEAEVSLYSHRPAVHDGITRVPGSFERTVRGIRLLLEQGVRVKVKTPVMRVNAGDIDEYRTFVEGLGAEPAWGVRLMPREDSRDFPVELVPDDGAMADFLRWRQQHAPAPDVRRDLDSAPCGACGAAGGKLHVEPDGQLHPCTQLDRPLGHALRDGIRKSWIEADEPRALRRLTWADLHGCRDCDIRDHCSRCHAAALHETGDALGPYETACRAAVLTYGVAKGVTPELLGAGAGPYREIGPGRLEKRPDIRTERDRDFARRHPWLVRARGAQVPDVRTIRRSRSAGAVKDAERSKRASGCANLAMPASTNHWRGT